MVCGARSHRGGTHHDHLRARSHGHPGRPRAGALKIGLSFLDRSRFRLEQGVAHRVLGQAYAATENPADADPAFRESLRILEDIRSWPEVGQTLLALGGFKVCSDPGGGRALIERARAVFEEIGASGWVDEARAALEGR